MIKLIASDMDGTLLDAHMSVSPENAGRYVLQMMPVLSSWSLLVETIKKLAQL